MMGRTPSNPITLLAAGAALILAGLAGCSAERSTRARSGGAESTGIGSWFNGRPRVPVSVAEAHPGSGVDQLDFFDDLERRDLVSHDDALHACLLLFSGQSGETFVQRAARAKQMGILAPDFDRPPREAVTVGELALVLDAGIRLRADEEPLARESEAEAMARLRETRVLPDFVAGNAGVTGAQLLTILGHAEDAIALAPPRAAADLRPSTPAEARLAGAAVFAPQPASQPASRKPVKRPPIDLEKEAQKPRPGQVLPDSVAPAAEEPAPAPTPTPAPTSPTAPETAPKPAPTRAPAPIPPPRAEGAAPSRFDGVASDLRYVAVDRVNAEATEILGPGEFVQWRVVDDGRGRPGEWQTLTAGAPIRDRIEVRTGLGVRATIDITDMGAVVLHRLSRVRIERKIRSDGQSQLGITIYRGMVEATASEDVATQGASNALFVRTPDQVFPLRTRALFDYDAFHGTSAREFRP